ncbi:hypothetical protein AMELA_G00060300 [Ameiurus melas]|uniref:Uncharacterized protein n=1 Tax=Ameiurus melas TaxID=219545 RepID=A0A7J6B1F9_AMEME|nr:hypothetical protein AMELA_G00060300 [Ameiurus melas]
MNRCTEERLSLSDVTYRMKRTLTGSTAGIKMVLVSVVNRSTESVVLKHLMQVNTPVEEEREEAHTPHTPVMLLH